MADNSKIEWTDATWQPVRGCAQVSEGCRNCYAQRQAHRFSGPGRAYEGLTKLTTKGPVWTGEAREQPHVLDQPLKWKKPRKVFVCSMADLFHDDVSDEFIAAVFGVMAACPQHTFQVLTKRPGRMRDWFEWIGRNQAGVFPGSLNDLRPGFTAKHDPFKLGRFHPDVWPLPNVWLGVSVEDQASADERIPLLLEIPAAVRWLSMEPLIGPVTLHRPQDFQAGDRRNAEGNYPTDVPGFMWVDDIDWVVCGGESGHGARPMHPQWARDIRDECVEADVPFFFKQWGNWGLDGHHTNPMHWFDDNTARPPDMYNVGKHVAGRELDGRTWDEWPKVAA